VVTVLVDAQNVRRSLWPNLAPEELVARCGDWATAKGLDALVVFDGPAPDTPTVEGLEVVGTAGESADDRIATEAGRCAAAGEPYWLVTSDRALRARAGAAAERTIGGGVFVRELTEAA
jgi:hypothetical protein